MNVPLLNRLSRRQRKLIYWIVGAFAFYTIVGFFVLPPIARSVAVKQLSKQLGREVTIQQVKLNPFAFSGTIRGLVIKEKNGDPFVSWDEVYGNFRPLSVFQHAWVVKQVSASNPYIQVMMNPDGTFNFSDILAKFSTNTTPAPAPKGSPKQLAVRIEQINLGGATLFLKRDTPVVTTNQVVIAQPKAQETTNTQEAILLLLQSVTNGFAALSKVTNSFAACVNNLSVSNCTLRLEDLANARPARLTLDQISVTGTNLSNVPLTNFAAAVSLRWNTNGTLNTEVNGSFGEPAVDIHLAFANIDLHPLDPYLDSKLSVFVIGSKLGMDGHIRLRGTNGELPNVTFNGDTWLNDFDTVDGVLSEDLIKWDSVHISDISAGLNPSEVAVKQMSVSGFYVRGIIETNRTINVLVALRISPTNTTTETATDKSGRSEKPKKLLAGDRIISTNALAQLPLKTFSVGSIVITNSSANFTDRSLTPNVNMALQQINGTISGISSEELQHADVSLHAKVDNVGPVDITGTINPFSKGQTNEIKIAVNDVDLTPLSSYSGKYAGYRIAKGKVSVALTYHLHGRDLKSQNVITIDQFRFGEKVNSPDATKLPVRLGVAVLQDRNGKIVLDVPIDGTLDNPDFHLGKVIRAAIWNIVGKAITSPFAVLGALFGGGKGEEIRYEDFAVGSADLTAASKEKLDVIVKALYERPGLQLEISGSVDTNADLDGLRAVYLEKELRAQKWQALRKADRAATTPDQIVIAPEERPALIKALYADMSAKGLIVASNTNGTSKVVVPPPSLYKNAEAQHGATELLRKQNIPAPVAQSTASAGQSQAAATDPFELALLNSISVPDDDFQTLAANRAKAAREYILQGGKVEAERVFLTESKTTGLKTEGPRVYLDLQ
ncbi:MAG TPA: DUF748 domain-containing protein [Verrucomicrobiae bacterium]|nr:DUF748 domain-containing protein [Verrucomicrobiae bacterium]